MRKTVIQSPRLREEYVEIDHPSGLKLMLYPMQGFSGAHALFATKYGSVDTCFKTAEDDDFIAVPEGIAHFLEHKLFESEKGDAFTRYAETGASANAFTSFDRTAYLFSCTENFDQSIDILLDFVTHPYFTEETVQKEQGIIGQEIRMYDDSPDWRVMFNLLQALYHNNPVRIDIAGTVESIAKIDADLLYRCYHTFYNLRNMVLAVAGNFEIDTVLEAADRILKTAPPLTLERKISEEPLEVRTAFVEEQLPVAVPLFNIGFKGVPGTEVENARGQILDAVLLEILAGEASPLYRRLYDEGLINQTFSADPSGSRDFSLSIISGESREPKKVHEAVLAEVTRLRKEGLDTDAYERAKKAIYGHYIGQYSHPAGLANAMVSTNFNGRGLYEALDTAANVTRQQLEERLQQNFHPERAALSVIRA